MIDPLHAVSGFAVGMLVGLTGVGGGSLMTPLLVLAFGIHPSTAVGTDLLYAAATKTVGAAVHGAKRTVDWRIVLTMAAGSVPAAFITLWLLSKHLGPKVDSGHGLIATVLGFALLLTAVSMLFRDRIVRALSPVLDSLGPAAIRGLTIVLGACLGVLVSISSVGAGAIGMTVLMALYPKLPASRLVGSDIAHAVPLTLAAGVGHWVLGTVNFTLLASLLAGSIPGIVLGSLLAARAPDRLLRRIIASALALVGGKLAF